MLIVIEGLDGAGKSTVAQGLARALDGVYVKTPPACFDTARRAVDEAGDRWARWHLYMAGLHHAGAEIARQLADGHVVVCDRYYQTTLADYGDILDAHPAMYATMRETLERSLPVPDHAFFLQATIAERARRLASRDQWSADDRTSLDREEVVRLLDGYARFSLTMLDTTAMRIEQVIERLVAACGGTSPRLDTVR